MDAIAEANISAAVAAIPLIAVGFFAGLLWERSRMFSILLLLFCVLVITGVITVQVSTG